MSSSQVSGLQNFKQLVPYNFGIEYSLLAVFLVLLALEKWVGKYFRRFKDVENTEKYYEFDNLPGPSSLPIIGSVLHLTNLKNIINMFLDYGKRFGPVIRCDLFHEKIVILNNAPMAQILLQSTDVNHLIKMPYLYDLIFKDLLGQGLITAVGDRWKSQRKLLSPAFSYRSFQNYFRIFTKYSSTLVDDLDKLFYKTNHGNQTTRQINSTIHLCGMRIISEAVMGLDLCSDKDGLTFYESVKRVKELFGYRLHKPLLLADFIWKFHPKSREYDRVVESINSISAKMITKHKLAKEEAEKRLNGTENSEKDELSTGRTMIEEMLRANMSESDMMYEVNTMIFAGFETTSAATHYLMFSLALNPEHQQLCREEIDAIFADPMKCPNGELTYDAVADMKYLERCFSETLRLFPPIFGFFRKLEAPLKLSDTLTVPKGANISIPVLTLQQNEEYFPNPQKFDPDRFLPENIRQRHPYSYIPFAAGPRHCIGTKFAIMASKTMAANILRHFYVQTTDKINDVTLLPNIFLTPERDYNFILTRRESIPCK